MRRLSLSSAIVVALLVGCNMETASESKRGQSSADSLQDDLTYFRAAGVELNASDSDAKGLRLDSVSPLQMQLNFKSVKIAYCNVIAYDYVDPNVADTSAKYCSFATATNNNCRSVQSLATSTEVVNAHNSLISTNNTLAAAAQARGYKLVNNVWSLASATATRTVSPYTVDRITLEEPCEPVAVAGIEIRGLATLLLDGPGPSSSYYQVFANMTDGSVKDISAVAKLTSDNSGVVSIDAATAGGFKVVGVTAGSTRLSATYTGPTFDGTNIQFAVTKDVTVRKQLLSQALTTTTVADSFGSCVSLDRDIAIIGANTDKQIEVSGGAAYIYNKVNGAWSQTKKLLPTANFPPTPSYNVTPGVSFGSSCVISGSYALVGAPSDNQGGERSGSVYAYELVNGSWTFKTKLLAFDPSAGASFGSRMSAFGSTVAIGSNKGVYIFDKGPTGWTGGTKIMASGYSLALGADILIVGNSNDSSKVQLGGSATIWEKTSGSWLLKGKLYASDAKIYDAFGSSVSIAGDTIVVGGTQYTMGSGAGPGVAYVFENQGSGWVQTTKLTAADGATLDVFGWAVGNSKSMIVVGAPGSMSSKGAVYVFVKRNGRWEQIEKQTRQVMDYSGVGQFISVYDNQFAVGVPLDKTTFGNIDGSAVIYDVFLGSNL